MHPVRLLHTIYTSSVSYIFKGFYLFLEIEERGEKDRQRNIHWRPLVYPPSRGLA